MATDSEPDGEASDLSLVPDGSALRRWERWVAGALGGIGVGAGGVAMFLTDNQAGTTAMLLLGAMFLLIAVQGTPVRKASKDTIELAKRGEIDRVAHKASDKLEEEGPDAARDIIEGAAAVRPGIKDEPPLRSIGGVAYREGLRKGLFRAVRTLTAYEVTVEEFTAGDSMFDYLINLPGRPDKSILVEVVHRTNERDATVRIAAALAKIRSAGHPGMIVSNGYLTNEAQDWFGGTETDVQFVKWLGPVDDKALVLALSRLLPFE